MSKLQQPLIKQLAREIANGNTCYIEKYTKKITTIDHSTEDAKVIAAQQEALVEVEKKIDNHLKLEKLSTGDQIEIMEYFVEEVADKSVRKQLSNGLKRKNPIRNFNQTIDSDMELKVQWRIFKFEEYQRWVSNFIIDAYNY